MKEVSGWQNWGHFYKSLLGYLLTCEYSGKHHSALCNRSGVGLKENRSGQIAGLQFRNGKHITVTFTTGTFLGHHGSSKSAWTSLQQSLCNNYAWYCKVPYNPCLLNRCPSTSMPQSSALYLPWGHFSFIFNPQDFWRRSSYSWLSTG